PASDRASPGGRTVSIGLLSPPPRSPLFPYTTLLRSDSWWMNFSNWVIRQERRHGVTVQNIGAWADRTLSGSNLALPNNESYLRLDRKSTRLNSSHVKISYAVFCLKNKKDNRSDISVS